MTFKVDILDSALSDINSLTQNQKEQLFQDYKIIENKGIEYTYVKNLGKKIFEIKSNEVRSLFKYSKGRLIIIGVVFVKTTTKTPHDKIKLAIKRLKETR